MNTGYILLYRSLLDWEWYSDVNTKTLFLHLLLTVNFEDRKWRGKLIKRGQRVCSRDQLAEETGLTQQSVRTALNKLKSTGEITNTASPQGTVITVVNYDKYQILTNSLTNDQPTNNQQTTNDQPVNNKLNKINKLINLNSCASEPSFDDFWAAYPKKKSKGDALKAWNTLKPSSELFAIMMERLATAKTCKDWVKDNGQYIPYPATWIRARGWEDEDLQPVQEDKLEDSL